MTKLLKAAKDLIDNNGGTIDSGEGTTYVMVRRDDFDALCNEVGNELHEEQNIMQPQNW